MDQVPPATASLHRGISLPTRIELERPFAGARVRPREPFSGSGWVLCPEPVLGISIFLGRAYFCEAVTGIPRPEVTQAYWFYPHSDHPGFAFGAELPDGLGEDHATMRLVVTTPTGTHEHSLELEVAPALQATAPEPADAPGSEAPEADRPIPPPRQVAAPGTEAMLLRVEDARVSEAGVLRVRGWAVSFSPIEEVRVVVDGHDLGPRASGHAARRRGGRAARLP